MIGLADIQFIPTDPETIKNEVIGEYEALTGKKLFPADPVRLFLLAGAALIIQQRQLMNDTARQTLLRYARGNVLDEYGTRVETPRIEAQHARVIKQRFKLSAPRPDVVPIPLGTRVSPGENIYFATTQYAQIPPASMYVDVVVECMEAGTIGNGFLPGQINILVDRIAYVDEVSNLTSSSGGSDVERDDPYRERIRTAPESFSTAGPEEAYISLAKSTDSGVIDVSVDSPSEGVVVIYVLMKDGNLPSQAVLDAVLAKCNDKKVRPLTDRVQAAAATQVSYSIQMQYWIDEENESDVAGIQSQVNSAVEEYRLWQKSKLGRDINPSELHKRVLIAGAKRVEIAQPVFTALGRSEVASDQAVSVTFGGVE